MCLTVLYVCKCKCRNKLLLVLDSYETSEVLKRSYSQLMDLLLCWVSGRNSVLCGRYSRTCGQQANPAASMRGPAGDTIGEQVWAACTRGLSPDQGTGQQGRGHLGQKELAAYPPRPRRSPALAACEKELPWLKEGSLCVVWAPFRR